MERDGRALVIIYRDHLGRYSETFITAQAGALSRFRPIYVGSRIVADPDGRWSNAVVANRGGPIGKICEYAFTRWGWIPRRMKALSALSPVLMHAHFGPDGAIALPLAKQLGLPLIVTFHGYDATMDDAYARKSYHGHRLYLGRRAALQRQARAFIAVSEFIKCRLLQQGFPEDKTHVHYIGIDVDVFRPDPAIAREPIVLFVGRLVEKKGCAHLIRALAPLQQEDETVELVVIGDGPLRQEVEQLASRLLRRYRFLGSQPPEQVRAWMNRAKVFSVPSHMAVSGDCEGLPIVFLEAQAMGLPVATYVHGGVAEEVLHGETGLLAPEGDINTLSAHIARLLHDEQVWRAMSAAGRPRIVQRFNLATQTRELEQLYAALR